jgi:hypothetical protein
MAASAPGDKTEVCMAEDIGLEFSDLDSIASGSDGDGDASTVAMVEKQAEAKEAEAEAKAKAAEAEAEAEAEAAAALGVSKLNSLATKIRGRQAALKVARNVDAPPSMPERPWCVCLLFFLESTAYDPCDPFRRTPRHLCTCSYEVAL